jgi:hypothetical protein
MDAAVWTVPASRMKAGPNTAYRSAFRDWAGEVSSFPCDVCEMAFVHVIENNVEAAYRRGDLFEKRRAMMDAWADGCTRPTPALAMPIAFHTSL